MIWPIEIYERLSASEATQLLFLDCDRRGSTRAKTETLVHWKSRFLKTLREGRRDFKVDCKSSGLLELHALS